LVKGPDAGALLIPIYGLAGGMVSFLQVNEERQKRSVEGARPPRAPTLLGVLKPVGKESPDECRVRSVGVMAKRQRRTAHFRALLVVGEKRIVVKKVPVLTPVPPPPPPHPRVRQRLGRRRRPSRGLRST